MNAKLKVSKITYPDGTEKFGIDEIREHVWGRSHHGVMYPEHSRIGRPWIPILLTREQLEEALK